MLIMTQYLFIVVSSLLFSVAEPLEPEPQYSTAYIDLTAIFLQNTDGAIISLARIKEQKASVFIFFSPECPLSQNYTLTLHNLGKKFAGESIQFYAVIPGGDFSLEEI